MRKTTHKWLLLACLFIQFKSFAQAVDSIRLLTDLKELSSDAYQGRKPGTYGGRLAQYFLSNRFAEIGLKEYTPQYKMLFTIITEKINASVHDSVLSNYKQIYGANIIGYIPGRDTTAIVISAHFDHLGIVGNEIYNGADDNGSGTCAMLAIARYFADHPPQHTLVFAAFDAEELVMRGSLAFLAKPPLPLKNIVLNINMDMMGTSTKNHLYVGGPSYYPWLKPPVEKVHTPGDGIRLGFAYDREHSPDDRTYRSDHAAFHANKIPYLYFGVPEHKNYHKPADDFSNISHAFYYHAVNLVLRTVIEVDINFPERPNVKQID
ncbi:M28 family peptidase [Hufsiella ginkgonis]|uniref:M28 family peptidase n=1 Tax=Hufsiella ginkgonis TaxID=2695274 RepID=A0A7K1Y483_9SPHI|nr:M28 family peptidase [Hufsiella ginkgonis]MXV17677.1 M28 family peptidase [Hufsiella ginkgonis]